MSSKIRIVIVDDSMFMRAVIRKLLERDGRFEVAGEAKHGREAIDIARDTRPDMMTMDVNMPVMDGVEAVRQIMKFSPMPIVMLSAHTTRGARATVEALSAGAIDFVSKPSGEVSTDLAEVGVMLVEKLLQARGSRPRPLPPLNRNKPTRRTPSVTWSPEGPRVTVIASSTGGPAALARVIPSLPANLDSAILIVQHMPKQYTEALARRLDEISQVTVREAGERDRLHQGLVFVAPGGHHMEVTEDFTLHLTDAPPTNGCRPSADVTMRSAARVAGLRTTGIVMTGMGRDGAEGLRAIHAAGGRTIAQDEASCAIFGMPRAAIELGAADRVIPLEAISAAITGRWTGRHRAVDRE